MGGQDWKDEMLPLEQRVAAAINTFHEEDRAAIRSVIHAHMDETAQRAWLRLRAQREGKGRWLPSQDLRRLWKNGNITSAYDPNRLQPSSIDLAHTAEAFYIRTEEGGLRPRDDEEVYTTLLRLPPSMREPVSLDGGVEMVPGETWLVRVEDAFRLPAGMYGLNSPKSTTARLGQHVPVLFDYHSNIDEFRVRPALEGKTIGAWLQIRPLKMKIQMHPGEPLTQLTLGEGDDPWLSDAEIRLLMDMGLPLSVDRHGTPTEPHDGLPLKLNFKGEGAQGLVGWKQKEHPEAIDIRARKKYAPLKHYDPIFVADKDKLEPDDFVLLLTDDAVKVPAFGNGLMLAYDPTAFEGRAQFGGWFDNGYPSQITAEVHLRDIAAIAVRHRMRIGRWKAGWTDVADIQYEGAYKHTSFPMLPKQIADPNIPAIVRELPRHRERVLVNTDRRVDAVHGPLSGVRFADSAEDIDGIRSLLDTGFYHVRKLLEPDETQPGDSLAQQLNPYVLIFNQRGLSREERKVFCYVRAGTPNPSPEALTESLGLYEEPKLFGKRSLGVSGHIYEREGTLEEHLHHNILFGQMLFADKQKTEWGIIGTVRADKDPVDLAHTGILLKAHTPGPVTSYAPRIAGGSMIPLDDIPALEGFETWSEDLVPILHTIYERPFQPNARVYPRTNPSAEPIARTPFEQPQQERFL